MALLPQDPRSQKLVMIAIVALGLAGVYQQLVWQPKATELHALETRLDTLDSLNRAAKIEVSKGNAAQMKAEAEQYGRELAALRHLVPTSNEVPPLLESISNAARSAGLELSSVTPDGVVKGDQFDTYKYKLGVSGPYHQVGEFLANVGSMPRIVAPINVTLTPSAHGDPNKLRPDQQMLDVNFGIQTYVAHTAALTPTTAKGAP
jgi:type IV pilus assembly protein PilO